MKDFIDDVINALVDMWRDGWLGRIMAAGVVITLMVTVWVLIMISTHFNTINWVL